MPKNNVPEIKVEPQKDLIETVPCEILRGRPHCVHLKQIICQCTSQSVQSSFSNCPPCTGDKCLIMEQI